MARHTKFIDVATHIQNTGKFPDDLSDRDRGVYNLVAEKVNSGEVVIDGFEEMTLTKLSKILVSEVTHDPEEPTDAPEEEVPADAKPEEQKEPEETPVKPREVIAERDSPGVAMSAPRGVLGVVSTPPENLASFPVPTVVRGTPVIGNRNKQNELGLSVNKEADTCHHLNPSWRGGVCMARGNAPCPYLGGNQRECGDFVEKSDVPPIRRRNRPL